MIYFYQPVVAKYREPFFDELSKSYEIKVYSSRRDFLNVTSQSTRKYVEYIGEFISFRGKVFWQRGLPFRGLAHNDVVVLSGNPRVINYMLLFFWCKLCRIKVIWWGQGWTAGSFGLMAKIRRKMMLLADACVLYTEKEAREFHLPKVFGLNNGIDTTKIPERNIEAVSSKQLFFIGRITEKSNIKELLSLLSRVDDKVILHIVGDGDLKVALQEDVKRLGISERVIWHGAIYSESEISEIASQCSAFIYYGKVGLSLIHAFSHRLPAIIKDDEKYHMPEFSAFQNGYNGVGFNTESDLLEILNNLDDYDWSYLSNGAIETVKSSFNIKDMVVRFSNAVEYLK
ncbi:glycosyltransferase [Vibrio alginolyticus]|uniref:glycosyltransferase n=1 Tax=Vibrio alginolyticus TaxID=663 RepID=UPI00215EAE7C|nr:glycosyltransferase [Vibrio alginolyticus]EKY4202499.1 glycosyltransferase [Vibrio alginolyticus]ELU8567416.1 glycosyltransferase [Vibrio alginolyticus]MCS0136475.1 glycosyltransferase [Vibrio alginolyticus]